MAVYTHLHETELRRFARLFRLGRLRRAHGVSAGTINTIYVLDAERGRFILRILEDRSLRAARFEEALVAHLSSRGLAVASMINGRRGRVVTLTPRQHVSVFEFLPGRELRREEIGPEHAGQVGRFLGDMHLAARGLRRRRRNAFSLEACERILWRCRAALHKEPARFTAAHARALTLIGTELGRYRRSALCELPQGIVHGDLFTDNAHFVRGQLQGVIDFEMASSGTLLYDVAVALCEWSFSGARFDRKIGAALIAGYRSRRELLPAERRALYATCRFAAARFALTRVYDFEVQRSPGAKRRYKDFRDYVARLRSLAALGGRAFGMALGL